jgi:hypothetical protein
VLGGALALYPAIPLGWRALLGLFDWAGRVDLVVNHWDYVGAVWAFISRPPDWLLWGAPVIGLTLLLSSQRKRPSIISEETGGGERKAGKAALQILFDPQDGRFMRPVSGSTGSVAERYFVAVRNNSTKSLNGVLLRAQHGLFVAHMIDDNYSPPGSSSRPKIGYDTLIKDFGRLDPGALEIIELFGASYADLGKPDNVLAGRHTFVLEVRGLDTPTVTAEFEYDPGQRPMLRMLQKG